LINSSPKGRGGDDLFAIEDDPGRTHDTSSGLKAINGQKHTITEYETQLTSVKKTKDTLVQKHLNYKVKSDRTIEKLSNLLTTANSKINEMQHEKQYYISKIKQFLKKFSTQLTQNV
jgi:predicted RNase H-like nuclease (RuvC/YqgF family)